MFENCLNSLKTVRRVFKLSGRFRYSQDGLKTVRTLLKMSRHLIFFKNSLKTVLFVLKLSEHFKKYLDGFENALTVLKMYRQGPDGFENFPRTAIQRVLGFCASASPQLKKNVVIHNNMIK